MARQVKTLVAQKIKSGKDGYSHRDHRSRKGRNKKPLFDNGRIKKFILEEEEFGKIRHLKKRKLIKFR